MSVTDERRPTIRRRDSARAGTRAGGRAHASAAAPAVRSDADELRLDSDQVLPPGRRDASGFWIPEGYDEPEALFSPRQRSLQEKQRQAHRVRRQADAKPDDDQSGDHEGAARVDSPEPSD